MGKNKVKDYLPLHWCKQATDLSSKFFGIDADPRELRRATSSTLTSDEFGRLIKKYSNLPIMLGLKNQDIVKKQGETYAAVENLRDLDSMTLILMWGLNKQVYKFDKDFTDELVRTDNVRLTKDMFDYLPFSVLYIDISDNKELCEKIDAQGFFVSVEKISKDWMSDFLKDNELINDFLKDTEKWCIHICKIGEELFFNDMLFFPNSDIVLEGKDLGEDYTVPIYTEDGFKGMRSFNGMTYKKLVLQTLIYLSSTEPDIDETEQSKETYRAPSALQKKPKNKFSEIRTWQVGVRYGSAFRKWKSESSHSGVSTGTGSKKRPHTRRAHWSYYWYGKRDGVRVRRPKWIAEMFIGVDKNNAKEQPAVIHKAINDN